MKKKRVAIIFRDFQNSVPNDPQFLWTQILKELAERDLAKMTVFDFYQKPRSLWGVHQKIKKSDFDEIYIVASYLSAPIYAWLCGAKIKKKVYLLRNRINPREYLMILKKYPRLSFRLYYLLSILKLGCLYRLMVRAWNVSCFLFPSQTSSEEFIKDTQIKTKCFILPSPLPDIGLDKSRRPDWQKKSNETWLLYTGGASLFRGLEVLFKTFGEMSQENQNLKLIGLFLKESPLGIIRKMSKKIPHKNLLLKKGVLSKDEYYHFFRQADVFIGPFCFSYGIPARPATLLEAMYLKIPLVISKTVNDGLFKEGYNCLKFSPFEISELQKKVKKILNDDRLRNKLVKNAKADVEDLNLKKIIKENFIPIFNY